MYLFIFELALVFACLLTLKLLDKLELLTENRFGIIIVAYLSFIAATLSVHFPTGSPGRIISLAIMVLCWLPGYTITKWIYKQMFPPR